MERIFQIRERGSNFKTEFRAGLTTFMTMAYILIVNPKMFADLPDASYNAIYIATAISAVIGTALIGILTNLPLAQASAMGSNAFFVYTVCLGFGLSYANALILILLDGIIFLLLTVTGLRKKILEAIPLAVRVTIPAGIGLFIAFIGLKDSGLIAADSSTYVTLASFNLISGNVAWSDVMPLLVTFIALIIIAVMTIKGIKGAVLWGILTAMVLYYALGFTINGFYENLNISLNMNPFSAFSDFGSQAFLKVFTEGFDFSGYLKTHSSAELLLLISTSALAFCLVDMFDTIGTLYGVCARGNLLTEKGEVPNVEKAMLADSAATIFGAVCGTSTVSSYVEASAGIAEGGKTGFSSIVTAALFLIAMFFSPIASLMPSCATSAALIYVGIMMVNCVKQIDWLKIEDAVPAFLTLILMPLTYNISYGIAFGVISYVLINVLIGKIKEIKAATWVIAGLFTIMFFVTH